MEEAGILEKITRSGFCYPALNQVGFLGAVSTAEVKGEGDAAGGGEGAEAATAAFEGWLRMP